MPLKLTLKPHEKVIIGGAVIQNGASTCRLQIENSVPILRQSDILTESQANTPCKRIYFAIQLLYIDGKMNPELQTIYQDLANDALEAAPSMNNLISEISRFIMQNMMYQALKVAKKLINYEEELIGNASKLS